MPTPTVMIGAKAGWEGKAFKAIKASPPLTHDEAVIAMTAAGKALPKSRGATNEGPLKNHMDYTKADFSKEPAKWAPEQVERIADHIADFSLSYLQDFRSKHGTITPVKKPRLSK